MKKKIKKMCHYLLIIESPEERKRGENEHYSQESFALLDQLGTVLRSCSVQPVIDRLLVFSEFLN